jgi:hypothetical protein
MIENRLKIDHSTNQQIFLVGLIYYNAGQYSASKGGIFAFSLSFFIIL